jgi:hypothetical protein
MRDVALGQSRSRANAATTTWDVWSTFCSSLEVDPVTLNVPDPIALIQVFAHRYRRGELSPSRTQVRSRTVGDALRAIGQTLAHLGHPDPRLTHTGALNLRLQRQLAAYKHDDLPLSRVKRIPNHILCHVGAQNRLAVHPLGPATADMITLGFFFLLRPGEYGKTSNLDSTPFRLCDVHLRHHQTRIPHLQCPIHDLHATNFVCLEFTNQKNGVQGELICLGRTGDAAFCPVNTVIDRVIHLQQHHAPQTTPLFSFFTRRWEAVTTSHLTTTLHRAVETLGPAAGLAPADISVHSLRASGATALFCAQVDTDRICLLGRWRSDEMLRYLHVQAYPVVADLAPIMLHRGNFHLIPNQHLPPFPPGPPNPGGNGGL